VIIGQHGIRCMNMDVRIHCGPRSHTAGGLFMVLYENASASFIPWLEVRTLHMCVHGDVIQGDWIYWMLVNDGAKSAQGASDQHG
jgi:hypothetical protein